MPQFCAMIKSGPMFHEQKIDLKKNCMHFILVMNRQLTPLSIHVYWPSHSWDKATSNFASFLFLINQTNNSWGTAVSKCNIEKFKVKVMGEFKGRGHTNHPVSNQCTSFSLHINWTNHSWDMANKVLDLEKTNRKLKKKNITKKSYQQNFSQI